MFIHRVVSKLASRGSGRNSTTFSTGTTVHDLGEVALLQARDLVQKVDWATTHPFATSPRRTFSPIFLLPLLPSLSLVF
jgi:hypothetical protein